jgi:elongation factor Ts
MVEISASMVKELRERSGAAMMDCKKALVEAEGDFEKAFEWLRQKGVAVASKKAARTASEGLVVGQVSADGKTGVIVEVNCETDFVARNEEFVALAREIAEEALKHKPADAEALLNLPWDGRTLRDYVTEKVAKTGENIVVRRLAVFELGAPAGSVGLYVHALGGKMGALLELHSDKHVAVDQMGALARELAMHVVSSKPQFVRREDVPADVIENERRIESGKADLADKKPEIRAKIIQGRVDKIVAERCLTEQPFVKDPSLTVLQYLKQKGGELGADIKAARFALFILGESAADSAEQKNGSS